MKKIIYYLPRVLAILLVAFLSLFILEGLGPDFGWQDSLSHLILALITLGAVIIAWKRPEIGGWLFVLFSVWILYSAFQAILHSEWKRALTSSMVIGAVPMLTGILFLIEGFRKNKTK